MVLVVALQLLLVLSSHRLLRARGVESTKDSVVSLPRCPAASCGNISVPYPFGIAHGCFRPGFQLYCNHTTSTQKLFLDRQGTIEVTKISLVAPYVMIKGSVFTMSSNDEYETYNASWMDLKGTPYSLSLSNYYVVTGCGVVGYVVDLDTGEAFGNCASFCDSMYTTEAHTCNGFGCCSAAFHQNLTSLKSYSIQLHRVNRSTEGNSFLSATEAYFGEDNINGSTVVHVSLSWVIDDEPSCEDAQRNKSSYACLSDDSYCNDMNIGYTCVCHDDNNDDTNPYIANGCQGKGVGGSAVTIPKPNCPTTCGNVSVPFPFGFASGCYRDANFNLTCNTTYSPPKLLLQLEDDIQITEILVDEGKLRTMLFNASPDSMNAENGQFIVSTTSLLMVWVVDYLSCEKAKRNKSSFACISDHSECNDTNYDFLGSHESGYLCKCSEGYTGNPYIKDGCRDIDECSLPEKYLCKWSCKNTAGSYYCVCPPGMKGDPTKEGCLPDRSRSLVLGVIIGVSIGVGLLLLLVSAIFFYQRWKKRNLKMLKEKHFQKNRGLLLKQLISSNEDVPERTKIFSLEELEKATNNFDETRILGRGGHGTVFKGILLDQRVVAIKKSKIVVQREIDQFINEVVILSQINHRNVVKLFGCCLETEVPLLVYEFVSNGTLFEHLHLLDNKTPLCWDDRLRIATEAVGALAYLHSAASISIFHRDVKSSNILLDDNCTAKVSDFGASRSIPLDQTHVVTLVQGTYGYLDPEYYHTGQLTEKSDVYSFGVILVELLTGGAPVPSARTEDDSNLSTYFLSALRDGRLHQIVDARIMQEVVKEEFEAVAMLAEMCLRLRGEERPTMKEVEVRLENLKRFKNQNQHPWTVQKHEESESFLAESYDAYYELSTSYDTAKPASPDTSKD